MFADWYRRILDRSSPSRRSRQAPPRPSTRLVLEPLEVRALLATITVTGVGNTIAVDGFVTLREAITAANTNAPSGDAPAGSGVDTINFNIAGAPGIVHTIQPLSALPTITQGVIINGYSQLGASKNTLANGDNAFLVIELDGTNTGFHAGLTINASNSIVEGLVINRFNNEGILVLSGGTGNIIRGNFLGTDPTGKLDQGNGITGVALLSSFNTVGGTAPGDRNLISGNDFAGVAVLNSAIAGNQVLGNFIGTDDTGAGDLGNGGAGVRILNAQSTFVGGAQAGDGNRIAFNNGAGIEVSSNSGLGNLFRGNSIHSNGELGIDLNDDGPTPNDPGDPDTGPNNLQNFPVLTQAKLSGTTLIVTGSLNSVPNAQFVVELFANVALGASGVYEGETFLGSVAVTTDAGGNAGFTRTFTGNFANRFITATATDPIGSTSEFSLAREARTRSETVGLFAPDPSSFFLRNVHAGGAADIAFAYGPPQAGWTPLTGDWNGDGIDNAALYNPATGTFYLRNSNTAGVAQHVFQFGPGGAGWQPIAGDWNGDGFDTVGVYHAASSTFYLRNGHAAGVAHITFSFGPAGAGWTPLAGDWNGDLTDTVGLYNPTTGRFYLRNIHAPGTADLSYAFGPGGQGWKPIVGDWNADGVTTVGVQNPATSAFFLRNVHAAGPADVSFAYGPPGAGWLPLAGDWDGLAASPLLLETTIAPSGAARLLDVADARAAADAALARWAVAGLSNAVVDRLAEIDVRVADLPGNELGIALNGTIYIDRDAAGRGWFVDPTPAEDEEFTSAGGELLANAGPAHDRADLLSVLIHELGHELGLEHVDSDASQADVMAETFGLGRRRLPTPQLVDRIFGQE